MILQDNDPSPVHLNMFYQAIESQLELKVGDFVPPNHKGEPVKEPCWKRNVRNVLRGDKDACRIVHHAHNLYRLPTPLPPEQAIESEHSWFEFQGICKSALDDVRPVTISDIEYEVSCVSEDSIKFVKRGAPSSKIDLSKNEITSCIKRINAAGARYGKGTLLKINIKEALLVLLHPLLHFVDQGKWIELKGGRDLRSESPLTDADGEIERILGSEGQRRFALHRLRERNSRLIRDFKAKYVTQHQGKAPCEVCGFDFLSFYPGTGSPFIEAHHKVPLSTVDENVGTVTCFEDIAFLCANCHRMIHRPFSGRYLNVEELSNLIHEK